VEVLDEAILLLHHSISQKQIRLERKTGEGPVLLVGDENRLKQLFLNLIINGIDAVLDGGLIQVGIAVEENRRMVDVTVSDNGYGIPEDVREKIFNPFFTTKVNRKNTGLGLSICQQIAQDHGGDISFSSAPGASTVFCVTLPLDRE
jgi:signal transduction histidine kinase